MKLNTKTGHSLLHVVLTTSKIMIICPKNMSKTSRPPSPLEFQLLCTYTFQRHFSISFRWLVVRQKRIYRLSRKKCPTLPCPVAQSQLDRILTPCQTSEDLSSQFSSVQALKTGNSTNMKRPIRQSKSMQSLNLDGGFFHIFRLTITYFRMEYSNNSVYCSTFYFNLFVKQT